MPDQPDEMQPPAGAREAGIVVSVDVTDEADAVPILWEVGVTGCGPDTWHRLLAEHLGTVDVPDDDEDPDGLRVLEDAEDAFHRALVAQCVAWERDVVDGRPVGYRVPAPGEVAGWPAEVELDVWQELVQAAVRLSGPLGFEWATARLRGSPRLQLELAAAHHYQVPLSVFQAWAPDDQAFALAYLADQQDRCPGCGVPSRLMLKIDGASVRLRPCEWCAQVRRDMDDLPDEARHNVHPAVIPNRGA